MSLQEKIYADYTEAYKAKRAVDVATLRLIKAAIQTKAIEARTDKLEDPAVVAILKNQLKQRKETLDSAQKNNREDIAAAAREELEVITRYLPPPPSPAELEGLIDAAIAEHGPNMGLIMKTVMERTGGSVDGKTLNRTVTERIERAREAQ